jgi:2-amino-4-hydroxy-6-hydroxymethyldihydropteridine diphosphokinase
MRAYLGLGSNLGDRLSHIRRAISELRRLDPSLAVSMLYETAPVGGPPQGDYLNCAVRFDTDLDPAGLLVLAHRLETEAGRVRTVANGPRTLDVDILLIEGVELATPELRIPHPRMSERGFVLAPLEDIDPSLVPPDWRSKVFGAATLTGDVRRLGTIEEYSS